jgi:hypothetical protein
MSWHFSQALVEEYSEAIFSAGALSALLSSMPSAQDDSCSDKMNGTFHLSPFGTMFVPSTDDLGVGLLTWYRLVSLAKTSRSSGGGAGIDGEFSGLWGDTARIIREVRPKRAWLENSPALTSRGLGRVLADLASMGFHATWGVLGASFVGADHQRDRIWIAAYTPEERQQGWHSILEKRRQVEARGMAALRARRAWTHIPAPDAFGVANGMAGRVERLQAVGDGQVPALVATAFEILKP